MSGYSMERLAGLFDRVSRYFNIVRPLFIGPYRRAAGYALDRLSGNGGAPTVLDIGTGTGTLAGVFAERGARVTGVDISRGMLEVARKNHGDRVHFIQAPAHHPGEYADRSFHLVTAGFVLHEMPHEYREQVLNEMNRLAGQMVLIIDYVPNLNPVVTLVERVEDSFYNSFLGEIGDQLKSIFGSYELLKLNHFMGLYLVNRGQYAAGGPE